LDVEYFQMSKVEYWLEGMKVFGTIVCWVSYSFMKWFVILLFQLLWSMTLPLYLISSALLAVVFHIDNAKQTLRF